MHFRPPASPIGMFQLNLFNRRVKSSRVFCKAEKLMLQTQIVSYTLIKLINIISSIFSSILNTNDSNRLIIFSIISLSDKFSTFNFLRLLIFLGPHTLLDHKPCIIKSFLFASHLSHHIVHVDISFTTLTNRHSKKSFFNTCLSSLSASFIISMNFNFVC